MNIFQSNLELWFYLYLSY